MKKAILIFSLLLASAFAHAQYTSDSLPTLLRGDINGDLIRETYEYRQVAPYKQSSGANSDDPQNQIIPALFISKNLFFQNLASREFLTPEVKAFGKDKLPMYGRADENDAYESGKSIGGWAVPLFDSLDVMAVASGINQKNADEYEYRVLTNRVSELVGWRPITLFCESYAMTTYKDGSYEKEVAYLGSFHASFGSGLTFEIRRKKDNGFISSISAVWVKRKPEIKGVFDNQSLQDLFKVYKFRWKYDFSSPHVTYYGDVALAPVDSLIRISHKFPSSNKSLFFYIEDKIRKTNLVEYKIHGPSDDNEWKPNEFDENLIAINGLKPGQYTLELRYSFQRQNVSIFKFEITPAWYQTLLFKIIVGILVAGLIGFLITLVIAGRQKRKIYADRLQKQRVDSELQSIRIRFNPHFVFNALNSIQGLMIKKEISAANQYLSEFSTLLRESLKESYQEKVNLATEVKMLDSYLRLEKLRFDFSYNISVAENLDKNAIEIPSLLLQPVIENAVKHGISSLYENGKLDIAFTRNGNDLFATVSDNGKGFDHTVGRTGLGLKLTEERIALLNKIAKDAAIEYSYEDAKEGTKAIFRFKNWLA